MRSSRSVVHIEMRIRTMNRVRSSTTRIRARILRLIRHRTLV